MHDIKFIRNNPEKFEKQMNRRGLKVNISSILAFDKSIRQNNLKYKLYKNKEIIVQKKLEN